MIPKITSKQQAWLAAYRAGHDATQAARQAGYKNPRRSGAENCAKFVTHKTGLKQVDLSVPRSDPPPRPHVLTADEVLAHLSDHAAASYEDFYDIKMDGAVEPNLRKAKRLGKLHLIKKLTVKGGEVQVLELYDAQSALTNLGRYYSLFNDKTTIDWRAELREVGLDPDEEFERLVQYLSARIGHPSNGR